MSCAQSDRLRHLLETQVAFHLRIDQFFNPPQTRRVESASGKLQWTVPYCMTIDQRYGHRLFERIQEQSSVRKASNHLRMSGRNHRTHPDDDRTMLNRPGCNRTFRVRNASYPTQLSRAATSLRKPDHAVPNDAALSQGRDKSVQLSCSGLRIVVSYLIC